MTGKMSHKTITVLLVVALSISLYFNFSQSVNAYNPDTGNCGKYQFAEINRSNRVYLFKLNTETGISWILQDNSIGAYSNYSWVQIKN